jgi:hypothetical protein
MSGTIQKSNTEILDFKNYNFIQKVSIIIAVFETFGLVVAASIYFLLKSDGAALCVVGGYFYVWIVNVLLGIILQGTLWFSRVRSPARFTQAASLTLMLPLILGLLLTALVAIKMG